MLQLSGSLIDRPVLSLRTGAVVATTISPIINPNNLKIEGFFCEDRVEKGQPVLVTQDIRDIIPQGIVVNDHEVLSDPDELVRLRDLIALGFNVIGKQVVTEDKQKLGKVGDFSADTHTLYIQKLYVTQSLVRSFSGGQLGIDRNQIVEITDRTIIVRDPLQGTKLKNRVPASAPAS